MGTTKEVAQSSMSRRQHDEDGQPVVPVHSMFERMAVLGPRTPKAVIAVAVLVLLVAGGIALLLVFCVAFGLSMDYKVFMLSRIREEWLRTGDNEESVAAILMVVVFGALATAEVSFVRMLGAGLALTILLDAFLIRLMLVPAVMCLAGRANWWAPPPLRRWHSRHGLTD